MSGNTVWPLALGCQKLTKNEIFGLFDELLTKYKKMKVNVARFASDVEWDFFYDFEQIF